MSIREGEYCKQIHLAAHFPGVNNMTVWSDPTAGSQIDLPSFVHLAQTAERGLFDFLFLAEGLRLREHRGHIHDPDGPLPDAEPMAHPTITRGRVRHGDPATIAATWRARAKAEKLSIREPVMAVTSRQQFVGTPGEVAAEIDRYVQSDACDGFIFVPHLTPHGLVEFVDRVVPLLQERGTYRSE